MPETDASDAARKWLIVVLVLTAAYSFAYLLWFSGTPLGQVPVLDGRENIALARQVADGTLPKEPFFRGMLYPAFLSLFAKAGLGDADLLTTAGILGVLFHLLATLAVFRCAHLVWKRVLPAFLSGLLFGLYPIANYFAAEPLDTTFSLALAMCAVWLCLAGTSRRNGEARIGNGKLIGAGLAISLAFLARPNFLPLVVALPLVGWYLARDVAGRWRAPLLIFSGIAPAVLAYGGWQASVSGDFGVMPWQGGYSLWVANGPGANGRYYAQKAAISYEGSHQNPARVESETLYQERTGSPGTPKQIDRFWRDQTKAAILAGPRRWIGLEFQKLYFFFNDFEQYNNKTFAFHKAQSPLLRLNPLSWGVVFCFAAAGLFAASGSDRRRLGAVIFLAGAYLAGGLMVFAGDRFRFPLAPFAALLAGGFFVAARDWKQWSLARKSACIGCVAIVAVISFSRFAGVHDTSTFVQDQLLLANASLRAGRDAEAKAYAAAALQSHPERADARHIAAAARFNQHLTGTAPLTTEREWSEVADDLEGTALAGMKWTQAVANWNAGRRERATEEWRRLAASSPSRVAGDSLAMLVLSHQATPEETTRLLQLDWREQGPYVWTALAALGGERFENQLLTMMPLEKWARIKATAMRLLSGS